MAQSSVLVNQPTVSVNRRRISLTKVNEYVAKTVLVLLAVAAVWSLVDLGFTPSKLFTGFEKSVDFVKRMFPLDFPPVGEIFALTVQTLAYAAAATVLAVIISLPVAFLSAKTTALGETSSLLARGFIVLMRAIPDLVFAIVFFRIFGLGSLPGVLAMGLHSIGMIGKLYADSIEDLDQGPLTSLRSTGAQRYQQVIAGVLPQLMPQVVATALHRFDINIRASVLLGFVGVGGLGYALSEALSTMTYQRGMALALVVLVLCLVIELISGSIRLALLGRQELPKGLQKIFAKRSDTTKNNHDSHSPQVLSSGRIRVSPRWDSARISRFLSVVLVLLIVVGSWTYVEATPSRVVEGLLNIPNTAGHFFPPSDGGIGETFAEAMLVTVQIGLASTLIGVALAIPIGSLAAQNTSPSPQIAAIFRTLIVIIRALPELILAIVLIVMMGLGPVPGTIALGIGSVGLLGKLVADSLEETDTRVQNATRACGAGEFQIYVASAFRQAMPAFVAHILYQLDHNIRSATLLGIVGAGGIGYYLLEANRVLQFDVVSYIVIIILVTVLVLELISVWIRRTIR
ncbi:phosphonate ABC transporter, permease protein PhnE [Brevibacterium sp. ACRRH]|uniref:phosphonate ABC transporter, permease protein PhnE n=1 Tax=Brevibacterium sp. ACRRH TaxID=2918183 RepID=UPI001EF59A6F|nr:phosphonate ABC transporter, permease protein PhnE [Brevibacterium sp. ACRRH]MCG7298905.1 phosphonate ABC transporter, permease protein PhnE [Brevibacterium sp. ACRRH]